MVQNQSMILRVVIALSNYELNFIDTAEIALDTNN